MPAPILDIIVELAKQGSMAVVAILMGYGAWMKDRELTKERAERLADSKANREMLAAEADARLADAKAYTSTLVSVQREVSLALDKVTDLIDQLPKARGPYDRNR